MELARLPGPARRPRVWQASIQRSPGAGTGIQSRPGQGFATTTHAGGPGDRPGDPRDDAGRDDIDELARRLSREAAGMGQNQYGAGRPSAWQDVLGTFDASRLGEFYPEEFELLQEQGRLGSEGGDPVLIAYASRYYSGMPFEDPVLASLREFVPNKQDPLLGVRELIVLSHLCGGFPPRDTRWKVASAYPDFSRDPPVMKLLGYFVAGTTLSGSPENSLWIVQQWDGYAPLEGYSVAQQTSGFGLGRLFGAEQRALNDRHCMIRAIIKGMLEAVAFLHDASIAHGALSKAVFRLSTFDDKDWTRMAVKVDGLGVATYGGQMPAPLTPVFSGDFQQRCRMDRQRLGLLILELVVSSLSTEARTEGTTEVTRLERVLTDVFSNDVEKFRLYISEESAYTPALAFLDSSGLWTVIELLLGANQRIDQILQAEYFQSS
jgi:hypothetical protein